MFPANHQSANRVSGLFEDAGSVLQQLLGSSASDSERTLRPRWDITELKESFHLTIELPGVAAEAVLVEFEEGTLSVSGEKVIDRTGEDARTHCRERSSGKFKRTVEFATSVDFEKIEASFSNGLLEVRVPKAEKSLPRKVEVEVKTERT